MLDSLEVLGKGEDTPPQMVDSAQGLLGLESVSIEQDSSGLLVAQPSLVLAQASLEGDSEAAAAVKGSFKKKKKIHN